VYGEEVRERCVWEACGYEAERVGGQWCVRACVCVGGGGVSCDTRFCSSDSSREEGKERRRVCMGRRWYEAGGWTGGGEEEVGLL
jgi:hypothetical protein